MEVRFKDEALERLEVHPGDGGYPAGLVRVFRKRIAMLRAADDERVFYGLKSLHYEKLKGARDHQRAMRLNDQWRLVLEFEREGTQRAVVVVGIEDYH
ncbi:MAG: type II toxin-antitoxin system RelE/ParE family toxin [Deltaproteobacteria bacterium]|nr:type II toxin-antitoxin system RelE/ParE family toxin [Deltaproteobacteria bacterium]